MICWIFITISRLETPLGDSHLVLPLSAQPRLGKDKQAKIDGFAIIHRSTIAQFLFPASKGYARGMTWPNDRSKAPTEVPAKRGGDCGKWNREGAEEGEKGGICKSTITGDQGTLLSIYLPFQILCCLGFYAPNILVAHRFPFVPSKMPGVPPNALQQLKKGLKSIFRKKKKAAVAAPVVDQPADKSEETPTPAAPAAEVKPEEPAPATEAKPEETPAADQPAETLPTEAKPESSEPSAAPAATPAPEKKTEEPVPDTKTETPAEAPVATTVEPPVEAAGPSENAAEPAKPAEPEKPSGAVGPLKNVLPLN
ncbi:hypothetical protein P175DRAFT_0553307 [Aspergillus ochraceoroseus IBT 24754]|uniref:Uncharacterized protein n=1 Tax=Aspergillus ochraceoroseus IBT 24754 TaxID=1392256 RepID=A0A2T5M657_9EURO|nr:uncharacterized protein P175DRAFT_0553307 [Aspergillus ochraceoroseus IBT 24754]PTU24018.1 hypothetical protein P175DRAFT_0553307 [Aspergillus ochraceoroseus IBT 24754]